MPPLEVAQCVQKEGMTAETLADTLGVTPTFVRPVAEIPTYVRLARQAAKETTTVAG